MLPHCRTPRSATVIIGAGAQRHIGKHIITGGVGLVACADMVVAIEGAQFRLSEVRLGLTPATISPFVVAKIGAGAARRWFLTAEAFGAEAAARMGLVHETAIDHACADAIIAGWLMHLRSAAPGAVADAKQLVRDVSGEPVTTALRERTAAAIAARRAEALIKKCFDGGLVVQTGGNDIDQGNRLSANGATNADKHCTNAAQCQLRRSDRMPNNMLET